MQLDAASNSQPSTDLVNGEQSSPRRVPVKVRVEYALIEDFLVDYTSNHTIGGMLNL